MLLADVSRCVPRPSNRLAACDWLAHNDQVLRSDMLHVPPGQALERMTASLSPHAAQLPGSVDAVLAALSCARAEVLWWFQHWEEASPPCVLCAMGALGALSCVQTAAFRAGGALF